MLPTTVPIIMQYVAAARKKHGGPLTTDLQRAHLIMAEEFGEFSKEVADKTRVHDGHERVTSWDKVEHELMQTISVGIDIYENIQKLRNGEVGEDDGNSKA